MHIKFEEKEHESKIPELVESFADIHVSEESSECDQSLEFDESPEVEPLQTLIMKKLLMKLKMVLSKLFNPRILTSTSLHILRI